MLADLEKLYRSGRLNNLSVILNGTRNAGTPYAYRYGYSYGYGTNPKSNNLIDYFRR